MFGHKYGLFSKQLTYEHSQGYGDAAMKIRNLPITLFIIVIMNVEPCMGAPPGATLPTSAPSATQPQPVDGQIGPITAGPSVADHPWSDAGGLAYALSILAFLLSLVLLVELPGHIKHRFYELAFGPIASIGLVALAVLVSMPTWAKWVVVSTSAFLAAGLCLWRFFDTCPRCHKPIRRFVDYRSHPLRTMSYRVDTTACAWCGWHVTDMANTGNEDAARAFYAALEEWDPTIIEILRGATRKRPNLQRFSLEDFISWSSQRMPPITKAEPSELSCVLGDLGKQLDVLQEYFAERGFDLR